ncbi:MAG: RIP metalloprotease RseP [Clostridia bacterium]|nr:RIP metalloprotease RseP [Clostridia bacterium]
MLTGVFSSVWTIIVTIFIFGLLITIHELGHYLVARAFKVGIREFSIGMGPAIHTWKCKTNKVSIRWLPIGGYVSMVGEDPGEEPDPEDEGKEGLNTKPVWKRILVVLAGPLTNIFFAFIVMALLVTFMPANRIGSTVVAEFEADGCEFVAVSEDASADHTAESNIVDSAFALQKGQHLTGNFTLTGVIDKIVTEYDAESKSVTVDLKVIDGKGEEKIIRCYAMRGENAATVKAGDVVSVTGGIKNYNGITAIGKGAVTNSENGLKEGDEIIKIDGTSVHVFNDLNYLVALRAKEPLDVVVIRNGEKVLLEGVVFPQTESGGVCMGDCDFKVYQVDKDFGEVMYQAFWQPVSIVKMTFESLYRALRSEYGWKAVSGPVGVGEQIKEVITATRSFGDTVISLVLMAVLISVSLGICNLLPIPVLDGGHVLFYVIELIRGKPLKPKTETVINTVFMVLLLGFMLFVTVKDIVGLF